MRLTVPSILALALLSLLSCRPKPPLTSTAPAVSATPQPPPPPPTTEAATRKFTLGDYAGAAAEFEEYLKVVPAGGERDQALFYLGLIHALPGETGPNWGSVSEYFNQLISEFPESHLRLVAQVILSLRDQATTLSAEVGQLHNQAAELRNRAEELQRSSDGLYEQLKIVEAREAELKLEADRKEQRIRQLNADLQRLIRVDTESRPRP